MQSRGRGPQSRALDAAYAASASAPLMVSPLLSRRHMHGLTFLDTTLQDHPGQRVFNRRWITRFSGLAP